MDRAWSCTASNLVGDSWPGESEDLISPKLNSFWGFEGIDSAHKNKE